MLSERSKESSISKHLGKSGTQHRRQLSEERGSHKNTRIDVRLAWLQTLFGRMRIREDIQCYRCREKNPAWRKQMLQLPTRMPEQQQPSPQALLKLYGKKIVGVELVW